MQLHYPLLLLQWPFVLNQLLVVSVFGQEFLLLLQLSVLLAAQQVWPEHLQVSLGLL